MAAIALASDRPRHSCVPGETAVTLGCKQCRRPTGTLHAISCESGGGYVQWTEAEQIPDPTAVCATCRETVGTRHQHWCTAGRGYVQPESAVPATATTAASTAVNRHLDGKTVPDAGEPSPLRRVELARIWLAEAERELDEAILTAVEAGCAYKDIGKARRVTGEAIRQRYWRLMAHRAERGGS